MVGNVNRTQSLDQTRKREAGAKQVSLTQILKCLKVSKYLPWKSIIILTWCWGTNQKYCASQQGDCKHIGYCDPNATCKKKANVSSNDDIEDQAMWLLAEVYDLVKTFPFQVGKFGQYWQCECNKGWSGGLDNEWINVFKNANQIQTQMNTQIIQI